MLFASSGFGSGNFFLWRDDSALANQLQSSVNEPRGEFWDEFQSRVPGSTKNENKTELRTVKDRSTAYLY